MADGHKGLDLRIEEVHDAIPPLLAETGVTGSFALLPLGGGANNKIFRVDAGPRQALLKIYFQHPEDPRDRLKAEFSFLQFAWENGLHNLPRPLACDMKNHLGLYEFIMGRRLMPQEITKDFVWEALDFYKNLNVRNHLPSAQRLPTASEACFTTAEHIQCVERRLANLTGMEVSSPLHREANEFIRGELSNTWRRVLDFVHKRSKDFGLVLEREISDRDRRVSPSDFGFHNAVLTGDNYLRFIDFEYAGWDDPARMVCDFFCQPAVSVPMTYYDAFVSSVATDLSDPCLHAERISILLPVYRVKWCCILLNDFIPVGSARRRFANSSDDQKRQKADQLRKAQGVLRPVVLSLETNV